MAIITETVRLKIRHLEQGDFDAFQRMERNSEVKRYTNPNGNTTPAYILQDFKKLMGYYKSVNAPLWVWAVENDEGNFIGTGALVRSNQIYEIGYRFLPEYWGRGYGKELCRALIDYAFEELKAVKITAVACLKNQASIKILDSIMVFVKEEYNAEFADIDRHYELIRQ